MSVSVPIAEREFTTTVIELAELLKWRCVHFRPAVTSKGWRTAMQGKHSSGFPDLLMLRDGRLIAAELKSQSGKVRPDQTEWIKAFYDAGCESFIWRPSDLQAGTIERVLR